MTENAWPASWLKGFLELAVLAVIAEGETYGYEIGQSLTRAGFDGVRGGTLYPILGRLEEAGAVSTQWRAGDSGPGRKYYRITAEGTRQLGDRTTTWHRFAGHLNELLKESTDA